MKKELPLESTEHPILSGVKCIAEYVEQVIPDYMGNPFIETLPKIYKPEQVSKLLEDFPQYNEEQRTWGAEIRMHCVEQIKHFMQPLPYNIELEGALSRVIRDGYIARNPVSPIFTRQFSMKFSEILKVRLDGEGKNLTGNRPTASGFAIIGLSGVGKTTAVERTLLLYPQVILHSKYCGKPFILKQVVWLKLECPASGSLKVLCQNFFRQVDLILGTNYYDKHVKSKSTKENMLAPMAQIASLHGLGVLVIDEIQRLEKVKNSGEREMLDFLTELVNTIGIPIILVGTFKSMFLFNSVFAQARRLNDEGDHVLSNMEDGPIWDFFLESLWDYQWTQNVCPLTDELKRVMYYESVGITDIAIKLYKNAQWTAIANGTETITPALIKEVAKRCLKILRPALDDLQSGNPSAIQHYEDLKPEWLSLNDYLKKTEQKTKIKGRLVAEHQGALRQREQNDSLVELVTIGVGLGLTPEEAEEISFEVIKSSEAMADLTVMKQQVAVFALKRSTNAFCESGQGSLNISKAKKVGKPLIKKDDPWSIVFETLDKRGCVSDALKKAGFLNCPIEDLVLS